MKLLISLTCVLVSVSCLSVPEDRNLYEDCDTNYSITITDSGTDQYLINLNQVFPNYQWPTFRRKKENVSYELDYKIFDIYHVWTNFTIDLPVKNLQQSPIMAKAPPNNPIQVILYPQFISLVIF